jgi:hypothetical protein
VPGWVLGLYLSEQGADRALRLIHQVTQLRSKNIGPELLDQPADLLPAQTTGGHLSLQICAHLGGLATAGQLRRKEATLLSQKLGRDSNPLLIDVPGVRRHGARTDAADVDMVTAAGHEQQRTGLTGHEDGGHHGDIR